MAAQIEDGQKILGAAFQETRRLVGMSADDYGRLFEVGTEVVAGLEQGVLPAQLDDKLLKLALAAVAVRRQVDFLQPLLFEARSRYGRADLLEQPYPLLQLFELVLGERLESYPWVSEGAAFRCRQVSLTDQSDGILLWAESQSVQQALLAALPDVAPARICLLGGYTLICVPAAYLFLKLDTTRPGNSLPLLLAERLEQDLPVGLVVPYEPGEAEVARKAGRLFVYSPDLNLLNEIKGNY